MNPIKGEVQLVAGERTYKLRFTTNALCSLEGLLGLGPDEIANKIANGGGKIATMRAIVWAALLEGSEGLTVEDAGRIMDEAGIVPAINAAAKAFTQSFPEAKQNGAHPRKAISRDGIGALS